MGTECTTEVTPNLIAAVVACAARVGRDPHAIAEEMGVSPSLVMRVFNRTTRRFGPATVAALRAAFRERRGLTAKQWFERQALLHGVGHATVRRAVYGFGRYTD